jgi:hypothetical protein
VGPCYGISAKATASSSVGTGSKAVNHGVLSVVRSAADSGHRALSRGGLVKANSVEKLDLKHGAKGRSNLQIGFLNLGFSF